MGISNHKNGTQTSKFSNEQHNPLIFGLFISRLKTKDLQANTKLQIVGLFITVDGLMIMKLLLVYSSTEVEES